MFAPQTVYTSGPAGYNSSGAPIDIVITSTASGNTAGDIVMLPAPSFNIVTGEAYWAPTAVALVPTAAGFAGNTRRIFGVVLTTVGASTQTKVRLRGVVNASCPANTVVNELFKPTDTTHALSDTAAVAANNMIVAMALEATTPAAVKAVLFDGIYGLGYHGQ